MFFSLMVRVEVKNINMGFDGKILNLVVDGRKILKLIFKKYYGTAWPAVFKQ